MLSAGRYARATTLAQALGLLEAGGRAYAGGTHLLQAAQGSDVHVDLIVDVKRVPELNVLHEEDGGFRVGAATTHHALAAAPLIQARLPALAAAAASVASRQVRNRGTIGGNLAASEPAFDLPTVLLALDTRIRVVGTGGVRELTVDEFLPRYGTSTLRPGELIESLRIPTRPGMRAAYVRCTRSSFEAPLVGVAARVEFDGDGTCTSARVALGNYGEGPVRCADAEAILASETRDEEIVAHVADATAALPARTDVRATAAARRRLVQWAAIRAARQALGAD